MEGKKKLAVLTQGRRLEETTCHSLLENGIMGRLNESVG